MIHREQEDPEIDRNNDEELLSDKENMRVLSAFIPCKYPPESNGNIRFFDKFRGMGYKFINAPFLLATLCAAFEDLIIKTYGQKGYKITWEIALLHNSSKRYLTFYDYKGGASFGSSLLNEKNLTELDLIFINDVSILLKLITNKRFPHPYDGCVIGEQA